MILKDLCNSKGNSLQFQYRWTVHHWYWFSSLEGKKKENKRSQCWDRDDWFKICIYIWSNVLMKYWNSISPMLYLDQRFDEKKGNGNASVGRSNRSGPLDHLPLPFPFPFPSPMPWSNHSLKIIFFEVSDIVGPRIMVTFF